MNYHIFSIGIEVIKRNGKRRIIRNFYHPPWFRIGMFGQTVQQRTKNQKELIFPYIWAYYYYFGQWYGQNKLKPWSIFMVCTSVQAGAHCAYKLHFLYHFSSEILKGVRPQLRILWVNLGAYAKITSFPKPILDFGMCNDNCNK